MLAAGPQAAGPLDPSVLAAGPPAAGGRVERPNLVFICTDDQAPTAVGAAGNAEIHTPHLDRLWAESVVLPNAMVVTPVCSPSRASLMTSRYGSELGITDWINPSSEADLGLDPRWATWPRLLADSGYRTGLCGKWHLGTDDRYHPTRFGYQYFMGLRGGGCPPRNPTLEVDGQSRKLEGFTVDLVTDAALAFIRRQSDQPFLLSLHYREPHAAWLPVREEDWEPYAQLTPRLPEPEFPKLDAPRVRRMTREYYASVTSVDRNVGRLLRLLDDLGLTERTVVIFTSDHGYNLGHHGVWYKGNAQWQLTELPPQRWPHIGRKQRPNLFDQSLRVPTVVRWPGSLTAGRSVPQVVSNLDWFPTLLALAGVPRPENLSLRGRDFLPLLRGQAAPDWDDSLYAEYSMHHGAQTHMRAWRTPEWKLMLDFKNPGRGELYRLTDDPGEHHDLFASQDPAIAAVRQTLREKILTRMRELGDPALQLVR